MNQPEQTATAPALSDDDWAQLARAHEEYLTQVSPAYDEVLHQVSDRIGTSGSIGKVDIGALVFWKRLQANTKWANRLGAMPDHDIRAVTAEAVTVAKDGDIPTPHAAERARDVLRVLPGFGSGPALASAVLTAAAPGRMAVYDRRARNGLTKLGLELPRERRYGHYMERVEQLRLCASERGLDWSARDVDMALYMLGRG
ncbi:hypothetical protein [Haloechinothrix salitolerans]|uniref:DUF222 domain-containing protein n=1 Tax=Haloechinothrix salitolerans TaxID=926830 RepID=A0ABW2BZQ1_9PSEU